MSMAGYTKLFNSILASTIWRADDKVRIVWITLLAMADKHGVAEGSIPGLADFARVSVADTIRALEELQAPDRFSRSEENEGRRIAAVDGGWQLLNHGKYREKLSADERREYLRTKQAEYRRRNKEQSTEVNNVSDKSTLLTQAEAEATPQAKEEDRRTEARVSEDRRQAHEERRQPYQSPIHTTHRSHAACGRVCVPGFLHAEFMQRRNHDGAYQELSDWYTTVLNDWLDGAHKADEPGEPIAFWRARYDEHWPAAKTAKASRKPAWAHGV